MRLIDADALQKLFNATSSALLSDIELSKDIEHVVRACLMVSEMLSDAPTIETEPVKHGHWIYKEYRTTKYDAIGFYLCSECGHTNWIKEDNYCSLCGAKMDKVEE